MSKGLQLVKAFERYRFAETNDKDILSILRQELQRKDITVRIKILELNVSEESINIFSSVEGSDKDYSICLALDGDLREKIRHSLAHIPTDRYDGKWLSSIRYKPTKYLCLTTAKSLVPLCVDLNPPLEYRIG